MQNLISTFLVGISMAVILPISSAEEGGSVKAELDALVAEVSQKVAAGVRTQEALAEDIDKFDALYAKYAGEKSEEVAKVLVMKAMLYVQVIRDPEAAIPVFEQILAELPGTEAASKSEAIIDQLRAELALAEGKPFPAFAVTGLDGKPLSLEDYKGKVVLVDFWATWCGPCVAELPNVIAAYETHHSSGFEIVGISLDSDERKLDSFIEENNMPWRQFFDGRGWKNELAQKYGVRSIPATFLLDEDGVIIGRNLRGAALEQAVAAALAQ